MGEKRREAYLMAAHSPLTPQKPNIPDLAVMVFGDEQVAKRWLVHPNLSLNDQSPADLLESSDGTERVKTLLLRIEYGVLA